MVCRQGGSGPCSVPPHSLRSRLPFRPFTKPGKEQSGSPIPDPDDPDHVVRNPQAAPSLNLPSDLERKYEESVFGRIPDFLHKEEVSKILKSVFMYRNYLWPSKNNPGPINAIIRKGLLYLVLSRAFALAMPLSIKFGIDKVIRHADYSHILLAFASYGVSSLLMTYYETKRDNKYKKLGSLVWYHVSSKTFAHLLESDWIKGQHEFRLFALSFERLRKGFQQHFGTVAGVFLPRLIDVTVSAVALLVFCGPVYFFNLLVTLGVYAWVTKRFSERRQPYLAEQLQVDKFASGLVSETFNNHFTVNDFNSQKLHLARYADWVARRLKIGSQNKNKMTTLTLYQRLVLTSGILANLFLCINQVYDGSLSPGTLVLLHSIMSQVFGPLSVISQAYLRWQVSFIEINDLLEISSSQGRVAEKKDAHILRLTKGEVEFRNVNFSVGTFVSKIRHFSLKFPSQVAIGITGPSGIGKSTMMYLIYRYLDPVEGSVTIDGQDVRDLALCFRSRFSLCPQGHFFFNDTIINNLRMANPDKYFEETVSLDDEEATGTVYKKFVPKNDFVEPEIVELVKHFDLYDKIMELPDAFEYVIGEGGSLLSGGERQKLNLIRTLLKDADFYIFDEPTNFLDNAQFPRFVEICRRYVGLGKTLFVVTHELSITQSLDRVLCFDALGKHEFGTHQELMYRRGRYASLWEKDHS